MSDADEEDELESPTEETSDLYDDLFGPPPLPYHIESTGYTYTPDAREDYLRDEAKMLANKLVASHGKQLLQKYHDPEVDFLGYLSSLILDDLVKE